MDDKPILDYASKGAARPEPHLPDDPEAWAAVTWAMLLGLAVLVTVVSTALAFVNL